LRAQSPLPVIVRERGNGHPLLMAWNTQLEEPAEVPLTVFCRLRMTRTPARGRRRSAKSGAALPLGVRHVPSENALIPLLETMKAEANGSGPGAAHAPGGGLGRELPRQLEAGESRSCDCSTDELACNGSRSKFAA